MRCPECRRPVRFGKSEVSCSGCGWRPSQTVLDMYKLAPMSNTRIIISALSTLLASAAYLIIFGNPVISTVLAVAGLAFVPVGMMIRDLAVKKMIKDIDGV